MIDNRTENLNIMLIICLVLISTLGIFFGFYTSQGFFIFLGFVLLFVSLIHALWLNGELIEKHNHYFVQASSEKGGNK